MADDADAGIGEVRQTLVSDRRESVVRTAFAAGTAVLVVPMAMESAGPLSWLACVGVVILTVWFGLRVWRPNRLDLGSEGLRVSELGHPEWSYRWSDCSEFKATSGNGEVSPGVVFDYLGAVPGQRRRRATRVLQEGEVMLPETFGLSAQELASLLNEWRVQVPTAFPVTPEPAQDPWWLVRAFPLALLYTFGVGGLLVAIPIGSDEGASVGVQMAVAGIVLLICADLLRRALFRRPGPDRT